MFYFEAGPGVKICIMDMLDEFTEIKKLNRRPELAHRIDKYELLLYIAYSPLDNSELLLGSAF